MGESKPLVSTKPIESRLAGMTLVAWITLVFGRPCSDRGGHGPDASALRADEGRGIAAISVGEPRAGIDPTISEWGNPIVVTR
jgi:hypothetical protein